MSNSILQIKDLCKSYTVGGDTQKVLSGLNFELFEREVVAVVGESGAGKSTLLNLVAGLDRFDAGEITSCGYVIGTEKESVLAKYRNQELGFVFQFHYLLEDFNAIENVCMPAWLAGDKDAHVKERARYLLDQVGLADKGQSFPSRLSGGERQRVAVARALMNRPKLILADEPTGSLDAYHAQRVFELIVELALAEGGSVLLITHDLGLARRASRQLELHKIYE